MPKIPTEHPPASATSLQATALQRNRACHQCRRKKLRCDAKEPCGPCSKSHSYAIKHRSLPATEPVDCTFDDPEEVIDGGRAKILKLEARIAELEGIVKEKDEQLSRCTCGRQGMSPTSGSPSGISVADSSPASTALSSFTPNTFAPREVLGMMTNTSGAGGFHFQVLDEAAPVFADFDLPSYKVFNMLWPLNLPPPDVLHHLVDVFFTHVPFSQHLVHKPTFMASLQASPTSPVFPQVCLLHAICGLASLYTPISKAQPESDCGRGSGPSRTFHSGIVCTGEDFTQYKGHSYVPLKLEDLVGDSNPDFGTTQIRWAATTVKFATYYGDRLLQVVQASLICAWYNYALGIHLNLYTWLGYATRVINPLGLNVAAGFEPLSRLSPGMTLLMPESSFNNYELLRNLYWMAFGMERVYMATNVWPVVMHEDDCSQTLPCRLSDFVMEADVPKRGRQRLTTAGLFKNHPEDLTDPFTLYIKGTILLGRVKAFNGRFRLRYNAKHGNEPGEEIDPRETLEFQMLDNSIQSFLESIPKKYKDPSTAEGGSIFDPVLHLAHLIPHAATILLHDPHADLKSSTCLSYKRMLSSIKAIMNLVYQVCGTSFDLMHLEHSSSLCWFITGAALIRISKARLDIGLYEEAERFKQELEVIRFMLTSLGKRVIIGNRQLALLDDLYTTEFGLGQPPKDFQIVPTDLIQDVMLGEH